MMKRTAVLRIKETNQSKVLSIIQGLFNNKRTAIKKVTSLDPEYCYFITSGLHGDEPNDNGDFFRWQEELLSKKGNGEYAGRLTYATWNDKPYHFNHDESYAFGNIVDTFPIMDEKSIDMLVRASRKLEPDYCKRLEAGLETDVSMGAIVGHSLCSECGNKAYNEGEWCSCLKNEKGKRNGQGKMIYEDNRDVIGIELSAITIGKGADPKAKNKTVIAVQSNISKGEDTNMGEKKVIKKITRSASAGIPAGNGTMVYSGGSINAGDAFEKELNRVLKRTGSVPAGDGKILEVTYTDPSVAYRDFTEGRLHKADMLKVAKDLRLVTADKIDDLTPNQAVELVKRASDENDEFDKAINDTESGKKEEDKKEDKKEDVKSETKETKDEKKEDKEDKKEDKEPKSEKKDEDKEPKSEKKEDKEDTTSPKSEDGIEEAVEDKEIEDIKNELEKLSDEDLDKLEQAVGEVTLEKDTEEGKEEGLTEIDTELPAEEVNGEEGEGIEEITEGIEEELGEPLSEVPTELEDGHILEGSPVIPEKGFGKGFGRGREIPIEEKLGTGAPIVLASFIEDKDSRLASYWVVKSKKDNSPLFKVTASQAFGEDVIDNYDIFTSKRYGQKLESEINSKGVQTVVNEWFDGGNAITDFRTAMLKVGDRVELTSDIKEGLVKGDKGVVAMTHNNAVTVKWDKRVTTAVKQSLVKVTNSKGIVSDDFKSRMKARMREKMAKKAQSSVITRGTSVSVGPTPMSLKPMYADADWIVAPQTVTLEEDLNKNEDRPVKVRTDKGEDRIIYNFNVTGTENKGSGDIAAPITMMYNSREDSPDNIASSIDWKYAAKSKRQAQSMPPAPESKEPSIETHEPANASPNVIDQIDKGNKEVAPFIDMLADIMAPIIASSDTWEVDGIMDELKEIFSNDKSLEEYKGRLDEKVKQAQEEAKKERSEDKGDKMEQTPQQVQPEEQMTEESGIPDIGAEVKARKLAMDKILASADEVKTQIKSKDEEINYLQASLEDEASKVKELGEKNAKLLIERSMRMRAGRTKKLAMRMAELGIIEGNKKAINAKAIELLKLPENKFFEKENEVKSVYSKVSIPEESVKRTASIKGMSAIVSTDEEDKTTTLEKKSSQFGSVSALKEMWTPGSKVNTIGGYTRE